MAKKDWKNVGTVSVDAGMIWLGDPCYLSELGNFKSDTPPPTRWEGFIEWLNSRDYWRTGAMTQQHPLGMIVSSGYGDGEYPVTIRRTLDGRVAEVRVLFVEEEG